MNVALVNLTRFEDFGNYPEFAGGCELFRSNGIQLLDYATGRSDLPSLLDSFHAALRSKAQTVLFAIGGIKLIEFLDYIDWGLVRRCGKNFAGLSDFTHFSWKAVGTGAKCYYGLSFREFVRYYRTPEQQANALHFLRTGRTKPIHPVLLHGPDTVDFGDARIIGGHSMISQLMHREVNLDLSNRVLFIEHHYASGESMNALGYWGTAIYRTFRNNRPRAILLGHSMFSDDQGHPLSAEAINRVLMEELKRLNVPIYYIDHFKSVIPLS